MEKREQAGTHTHFTVGNEPIRIQYLWREALQVRTFRDEVSYVIE